MNLQKTLESSLGSDGALLLYEAAEEASYADFTSFLMQHPKINTVKSKLELASTSFQYCGLGIINLTQIGPEGGRIVSPHSHHVTGWLAKFGKRETPGCFFTRGWIAGTLAVIFEKHCGYYSVEELACKMTLARECLFEVTIVRKPSQGTESAGHHAQTGIDRRDNRRLYPDGQLVLLSCGHCDIVPGTAGDLQ